MKRDLVTHSLRHSELVCGGTTSIQHPWRDFHAIGYEDGLDHSALRHVELVSASMAQWLCDPPLHRQIAPVGIAFLDQVDFPLPVPAFQLFLPRYRIGHGIEKLCMDQPKDPVSGSEPAGFPIAMLPDTLREIGRHADIQCPALLAGEYVNAGAPLSHDHSYVSPWMLKQVQHDGKEKGVNYKFVTLNLFQGPWRNLGMARS